MSVILNHSITASSSVQPEASETPPAFLIPLFKSPLILYKLGLGWMLGQRFIRLTHIGRRSGKVYESILAVLDFNEQSHEILVVSPWQGSNWFRNIQAAPALEVEFGSNRFVPTQRLLSPQEIATALIKFRGARPIFSRMVAQIPRWKIDSTYDEFLTLAKTLRGVAFRPKTA